VKVCITTFQLKSIEDFGVICLFLDKPFRFDGSQALQMTLRCLPQTSENIRNKNTLLPWFISSNKNEGATS